MKNSGKKDSDLVAKKKAGKKLSKGPEGGGDGDEKEEDEEEGDEEDVEIDREDGTATPTEDRLSHPLEGAISTINALALEEKEREVTEKEQEVRGRQVERVEVEFILGGHCKTKIISAVTATTTTTTTTTAKLSAKNDTILYLVDLEERSM